MEQNTMISDEPAIDASATSDPEWRYVPVRRTAMDDSGSDMAMEELVLETEGGGYGGSDTTDIAGSFRDTAEGDTLLFSDLATNEATSRYDDDGDLDLYVVNSPGGDNALAEPSTPRLQELLLQGEVVAAADAGAMAEDGRDAADGLDPL